MAACFGRDAGLSRSESSMKRASKSLPRGLQRSNTIPRDEASVRAAWKDGTLAFSFSGGGFIIPYLASLTSVLVDLGIINLGRTLVGGSSAGALVAATLACGLHPRIILSTFSVIAEECRAKGVYRNLSGFVRAQLEATLPPDAHELASGVAHVGVTRALLHSMRPRLISSFDSREDLIDCLLASCHIPLLSTGSITCDFRGKAHIDGGLTELFIPPISHAGLVVNVSCLTAPMIKRLPFPRIKDVFLRDLAIFPGLHGTPWPFSDELTLKWALSPSPAEFTEKLIEYGRADAEAWIQRSGIMAVGPSAGLSLGLPVDAAAPGVTVGADCAVSSSLSGAAADHHAAATAAVAVEAVLVCMEQGQWQEGQQQQQQQRS